VPELEWRQAARDDLRSIIDYIAAEHPMAARALWEEIETKVGRLPEPKLYRRGRVKGTREMIVRPNYLVIYSETPEAVTILRVLHAAQMWP
jgi:toxin ParE1/3/4